MSKLLDMEPSILPSTRTEKKLALPLWARLQHSPDTQPFNIIVRMRDEDLESGVKALQASGLQMSDFHSSHPTTLIPGRISKTHLLTQLIYCDCVTYIEGIAEDMPD